MVFSNQQSLYSYSLLCIYITSLLTFIALKFLQAPYGKHRRPGWGPTVSPPLAWFLMESPTLWLTFLLFPYGIHRSNFKALLLISPFLFHYLNRTCVYPLHLLKTTATSPAGGGFPVVIALMAFCYNLINTFVQVRWISEYKDYENDGLFWWRFVVGLLVFGLGFRVNTWADGVLVGLKKEGGGGYKVPRGGLFELISCPNYFGEILEWLGWAIMSGSWAGFAFFVFTCANLVPRASANHKWYSTKFGEDYPKRRKAVIPFLY